jgi:CheY-like chemotaxis protein
MKNAEYIIVLADDDLDDQAIIKEIFLIHTDSITIFNVQDGEETIRLLQRLEKKGTYPCLIILDINMPRMDGRETLLHLKRQEAFKDIPVVLFSTSQEESDKKFAWKHGATYITKPFTYKNMEEVVKGFINQCQVEGARRGM